MVFEEPPPAKAAKSRRRQSPAASPEIAALAEELQFVKADLQAAIEELQANNEELQSANEELQSTNEELQSTNEELDTSREEIQSMNEELLTVNAELQAKMENLYRAESDMKNLLDSTRVAMIFLDRSLRLQRFTPTAVQLVKLIPTDVGRSLEDLVLNLDYDQLLADAREVLDTLKPREREVRGRGAPDRDQTWFLVRLIPYLTMGHAIEGVVIIGIDITRLKRTEELATANAARVRAAQQYAEDIVDTVREPLLVLDGNLKVVSANHSFYEFFQVSPAGDGWPAHLCIRAGAVGYPGIAAAFGRDTARKSRHAGFSGGARFSGYRSPDHAPQCPEDCRFANFTDSSNRR